jgi:hypothetical protein
MAADKGRSVEDGLATGRQLLAVRNYHKAVQIHRILALRFPRDPRVHMALGQSFRGHGDREKMVRAFHRAILLQPEAVALYYNFGNAVLSFDDPDLSMTIYRRALILDPTRPEILTGLSLALLQAGDWAAAWPLYETRESCRQFTAQMDDLDRVVWDGKLDKGHRILLIAEQGAGDAIQFIRYARYLAEAGMRVLVHCQPALARLFSEVPWIENLSTGTQPDFDSTCLIMSLPHRFGTRPDKIPDPGPYLHARPDAEIPARGKVPSIGLVWAGTPKNTRDEWRSCPSAALTPLLEIPGLRFQSLQYGWRPGAKPGPWSSVSPLDESVTDYADTADVIARLDLVISVDTSVAHLAGAMGKPVWLLLGRNSDWRWLTDRNDTPWYPMMRLFRMTKDDGPGGDEASWRNLVGRVAGELEVFAKRDPSV